MEALALPSATMSDPLRDVLQRMRSMQRSGVIVREDDRRYWLLTAAQVVIRLSANPQALVSDVTRRTAIEPIDPGTLDHVNDLRVRLRDSSANHGVLAFDADEALLFSESETLQAELRAGPSDCYCSKGQERLSNVTKGQPCPNKDGGTVACDP